MESQDKLYKQFQNASQKAPEKDFPAMEKVWENIEIKLDKKALTKENNLWKKIAIAASVLLVTTLGFQLLKWENDTTETKPKSVTNTIKKDSNSEKSSEIEAVVSTPNPIIKENAIEIMESEVKKQENYTANTPAPKILPDTILKPVSKTNETEEIKEQTLAKSYSIKRKIIPAIGVERAEEPKLESKNTDSKAVIQKQAPLYVLNGKAITENSKDKSYFENSATNSEDVETVDYLSEPLYIINGVEYSEEELFGPNPTSPYFPLNKQKIVSTKILQGNEATVLYGEKGKKGVVIITTKKGKPAGKKK